MSNLSQCPPRAVIDELTRRRLSHQPGEPLAQAPQSIEQAFSWQQVVAAQMASVGKPIQGWKCALPTEGRWGLAPIFQLQTSACCQIPAHQVSALVEPEYAWCLTRDLLPQEQPLDAATVRDSMQCRLALEILADRFQPGADIDYYSRLADGLLNHSVWVGPPLDDTPAHLPLSWRSAETEHNAVGAHPAGDPFAPVEWLVAFLHQRKIALFAGQVIITGSLDGVWRLPVNQPIKIQYDMMARVEVEFTPLVELV